MLIILRFATARENTIHSLNKASQKGADFVEFDVQLTKDKIPIIFHDFHVLVSVAQRSDLNSQSSKLEKITAIDNFHEIAIKDLRLRQLRLLHV